MSVASNNRLVVEEVRRVHCDDGVINSSLRSSLCSLPFLPASPYIIMMLSLTMFRVSTISANEQ